MAGAAGRGEGRDTDGCVSTEDHWVWSPDSRPVLAGGRRRYGFPAPGVGRPVCRRASYSSRGCNRSLMWGRRHGGDRPPTAGLENGASVRIYRVQGGWLCPARPRRRHSPHSIGRSYYHTPDPATSPAAVITHTATSPAAVITHSATLTAWRTAYCCRSATLTA